MRCVLDMAEAVVGMDTIDVAVTGMAVMGRVCLDTTAILPSLLNVRSDLTEAHCEQDECQPG